LGPASPWAWIVAAAGMALVVACIAEVASRFSQAGGQYLYARAAFGRFAGIEMAWLAYLVRLTAAATNANLFVIYLGEFWPQATGVVESRVVVALLLLPLAVANYRGVGPGLHLSNGFIVAKLLPLGLFVLAGLVPLMGAWAAPVPVEPATAGAWLEVVLLLVFAYGGFEAALFPMGEAKDARRDAPVALFAGLAVCTLVYTLAQAVVVATLSDPGASPRPLAAAAREFLGPAGATLMTLGALLSVYGYLTGAMLVVPRLIYAAAEQRDLPPVLGAVHPRFRTPYVSVVVFAALTWGLAAAGSFLQNLTLSAVSRLVTYGALCVALLVLRWKERRGNAGFAPAWFRVPGGPLIPLLGLGFTAVLALRMSERELLVLGATLAAGLLHWVWARRAIFLP
jgi:basic amino acid/polyamine antiporter, APA family